MSGARGLLIGLSDALDRAARLLALAMLAVLVATVALQVVARYGFASPPIWTEEAARYAMIWVGLLGATVAFKSRFDPALAATAPAPLRRAAAWVQAAAVLGFVLPVLWFCVVGPNGRVVRGYLMRHWRATSETLEIPMILVAGAVPLAFAAILVHLAARLAGDPGRRGAESYG